MTKVHIQLKCDKMMSTEARIGSRWPISLSSVPQGLVFRLEKVAFEAESIWYPRTSSYLRIWLKMRSEEVKRPKSSS